MIRVYCYSGWKADERPVGFQLDGHPYAIVAVLEQWYDPGHAFFKVRADDGNLYVLRHQTAFPDDAWEVV